jgi:hypothetical protein
VIPVTSHAKVAVALARVVYSAFRATPPAQSAARARSRWSNPMSDYTIHCSPPSHFTTAPKIVRRPPTPPLRRLLSLFTSTTTTPPARPPPRPPPLSSVLPELSAHLTSSHLIACRPPTVVSSHEHTVCARPNVFIARRIDLTSTRTS